MSLSCVLWRHIYTTDERRIIVRTTHGVMKNNYFYLFLKVKVSLTITHAPLKSSPLDMASATKLSNNGIQNKDTNNTDPQHYCIICDIRLEETQHTYTLPLCWMSICWVSCFIYYFAECHYAEYHYAEWYCAECHYDECCHQISGPNVIKLLRT